MLNFFFLKEISNYCDLNFESICLIEDLNEDSDDNDETDSESNLSLQTSNSISVIYNLDALKKHCFSQFESSSIQNPQLEIIGPPPKIKNIYFI